MSRSEPLNKLTLESIFAKRIVRLSKKRKQARISLDKDSVMEYNGRIDELRYVLHEILEER